MSNIETLKELKKNTLGLDDKFRFGCRMCGKCCTHREDIILSPMDFYRLSKVLRIPPIAIYQEYCHTTIGKHSHMPVQMLRPVGEDRHCPLKKDNLCSVHNGKPTSCAIFPLGRYIENGTVKYCSPWIAAIKRYRLSVDGSRDSISKQKTRRFCGGMNLSRQSVNG